MKRYALIFIALIPVAFGSAQSVRITQIDTGDLLVRGRINAYVSITDPAGNAPASVDPAKFTAAERTAAGSRALDIVDVAVGATKKTGIDFLLLIDNSGSMYDPFRGGGTRIEHARQALISFLHSVSGSQDQVALGAFNTYLYHLAPLGASTGEMIRSLERLERPDSEAAYTELYQALVRFLPEFASRTGRKAVIVLSDGENYPFSVHSGVPHPVWGNQLVTPDDVIRRYRQEEVTLYAINFADVPDPNLARIAAQTGGTVFDASDSSELSNVYATIRKTIRGEVRLTIRVPAAQTVKRNVTVSYEGSSDNAVYFAPLLLGAPGAISWLIPLLIALGAAAALAGLHFVSFESAAKRPEIQAVGAGKTVLLKEDVTVIGSAPDADVSLAGNRGIELQHATVVHDSEKGTFTLVSERPVRVNNSLVKNRRLSPGDVIAIEDVTLVFDAPEDAGSKKGSPT